MRVGGARPPLLITFTLTSKVAVYAPAEWADTLTLFISTNMCTLWLGPSPLWPGPIYCSIPPTLSVSTPVRWWNKRGGGGGLAEPFRGKSAEDVPCWLSSLVGSATIFTSGHYIVDDRGEGRKAKFAVLLHTYCQGALTDMFECLLCYVQYWWEWKKE